jgi:2,5-diamino-6-(ribosylamino)-4(3H)-pyrimidinone 5'-phosphate reductase
MSRSVNTQRPRVICHMMGSVDGRIVTDGWSLSAEGRRQYESIHATYSPDGWLCGRVTMEQHFAAGVRSDSELGDEYRGPPREDFIAPGDHDSFAFAVDPRGKLVWKSGDIDGDHVVAILSERVSDSYLASLRSRHISYLLAGAEDIDLAAALAKIGALGVRTLMLEGGGRVNGSLLEAGLVDEVSLLIAPVVDGRVGSPSVFDIAKDATPYRLALESMEQRDDALVWLRYRVVFRDPAQPKTD